MQSLASILSYHQPDIANLDDFEEDDDEDDEFDRELTPGKIHELTSQYHFLVPTIEEEDPFSKLDDELAETGTIIPSLWNFVIDSLVWWVWI